MYITYDIYFAFVEEFQPTRFKRLAMGGIETVRAAISDDVDTYNMAMEDLLASGCSAGRARDIVNERFFAPEEVY